ncbi:MAG TPA: ROK family protein [Nocardioidaceae bacterium]|nr:ROK family protein [Nocardioidaceae bacterium]
MADARVGIDIGGTGIKGALVDVSTGELVSKRTKIDTPRPATPEAVLDVVAALVDEIAPGHSPVGVTVPAVVRHGVVRTAANIDPSWIGVDADALMEERLGRPVHVLNDADAAGYAEVMFGAARGRRGVVMVTTLGTGIGTALVHDGVLVPNNELGHIEIGGRVAETFASNSAREREELSYPDWAERLTTYYRVLERLISPDLFVVGGGVSKSSDQFLHLIDIETEIVPAALGNNAGIIGAALLVGTGVE